MVSDEYVKSKSLLARQTKCHKKMLNEFSEVQPSDPENKQGNSELQESRLRDALSTAESGYSVRVSPQAINLFSSSDSDESLEIEILSENLKENVSPIFCDRSSCSFHLLNRRDRQLKTLEIKNRNSEKYSPTISCDKLLGLVSCPIFNSPLSISPSLISPPSPRLLTSEEDFSDYDMVKLPVFSKVPNRDAIRPKALKPDVKKQQ